MSENPLEKMRRNPLESMQPINQDNNDNPLSKMVPLPPSFFDNALGKTTAYLGNVGSQLINRNLIDPTNLLLQGLQAPAHELSMVQGLQNPWASLASLSGQKVPTQQEGNLQIPQIPQMMPGSPISNAADLTATGLELGVGAYGLGKLGYKGLKYLAEKGPQKAAENVVSELTGGRSVSDIRKAVAERLRKSQQTERERVGERFDKLKEQHGEEPIRYEGYSSVPSDLFTHGNYDLRRLHQEFIDDPTFNKAHNLQSQLGHEYRQIENQGSVSIADQQVAKAMKEAQNSLRYDIKKHFHDTNYPDSAYEYESALDDFRRNVVPYEDNKKIPNIYEISHGKNLSPKATELHEIFAEPGRNENIRTIVSHLRPESYKDIIASQFGKIKEAETPKEVARKIFNMFRHEGYEDYNNRELDELARKAAAASKTKEIWNKVLPTKWLKHLPEKTKDKKIAETIAKQGLVQPKPLDLEITAGHKQQ